MSIEYSIFGIFIVQLAGVAYWAGSLKMQVRNLADSISRIEKQLEALHRS